MDRTPTPVEALLMAIQVAGSQSALSRECGMSQPVISLWLKSGKGVSPEFVLRVEAATGVPRHHLRPDIYPADLGPSPSWHGVDRGAHRVSFNQTNGLQVAQPFDGRTSKATEADGATRAIGEGLAA